MNKRKPPLNKEQKRIFSKLVRGHFLRRFRRGSKEWYVLYDSKVNPIEKVREKLIRTMDKYLAPSIKIWRRDRYGNILLNLNMVRQIDGRNPMKKIYKRRHDPQDSGITNKNKTIQNEQESNLLF